MKSRFIILLCLFGTLMKLTISQLSRDAAHNLTYIREQKMIFHLNYIKEIFLCITEMEEEITSQRLINLAKTNNINEEFNIKDLDKYAGNEEDLNIIRICKKSAYYTVGTSLRKQSKGNQDESKRKMTGLIGGKRFKIYRELLSKRKKKNGIYD